ncbi:MAG: SdrD B-like domain-containing protein, partial [Cellulosilyticaceae bacterium]
IEVAMGLSSDFRVKGSLDANYVQYPAIGRTTAGDTLFYQLNLTNNGDTNIMSVEMVNIMPHVGDTGVILTATPRNSQFAIYPIQFGDPTLTPVVPTDPTPSFSVYYSQSYDPIRFGAAMHSTIGSINDWSLVPPTDTTTIKAYKLILAAGVFRPGQTLSLTSFAVSPSNAAGNLEAWDSFASQITYVDEDGSVQTLLATEPEMAGVKIIAPPPGTVTLGGFVWEDLAKTGVFQAGDPGINDVAVVLYSESGTPLNAVFTAPNTEGTPGYYSFTGLQKGKYILRFIPNTAVYALTQQVLSDPYGSMPSPETGLTPVIDMTTLTENTHITAGVINISSINTILKVNASANKVLRDTIHLQMLLGMKLEDTKDLIES